MSKPLSAIFNLMEMVITVVDDKYKQEVLEIIEEALQEIYNETVSTSVLLMKCQRICMLLDSRQENEWIWCELEGYKSKEDLPSYRLIITESTIKSARIEDGRDRDQLILSQQLRGKPLDYHFPIFTSCNYLEQSNERLKVSERFVINPTREEPIKMPLGILTVIKPVEISVVGMVSIDLMRSIVAAIKTRVHEFLLSQRNSLFLLPQIQGIFDESMNTITSKLSILNPQLLEKLRSIIQELHSGSELDWQSIANACRTIIQRFTDLIYIEEMIPEGESRPAHDKTKNKCRHIAGWALKRIGVKFDDSPEGSRIDRIPAYLDDYFEMIIRSVEKVKHKDTRKLRKDEVDRVVNYTILWMADLIDLLDPAKYSWQ